MTDSNNNIKDEFKDVEMNQEQDENMDVLNTKQFRIQNSDRKKMWVKGYRSESSITDEEKEKYKDHAYLLQFQNNKVKESQKNQKLVHHPTYSYQYNEFDKSYILPTLSATQLDETEKRFKDHIGRLEHDIFTSLKKKEIEQDIEEKESAKDEKKILAKQAELARKRAMEWTVPEWSVPIRADIRTFDFIGMAKQQKALAGRLFDCIMMDPPWILASANPTRGVALGYSQLGDNIISNIPVPQLQDNGLIFIWVINAKYRLALQLLTRWGYKMIGDIAWVKQTVNRRIANGHGFYLQHAKETCLVGLKGKFQDIPSINTSKIKGICSDVIYSERRGQSQKPEEIYQYIEHLIPKGYFLEIFARRNNLRNGWVSIGNEL